MIQIPSESNEIHSRSINTDSQITQIHSQTTQIPLPGDSKSLSKCQDAFAERQDPLPDHPDPFSDNSKSLPKWQDPFPEHPDPLPDYQDPFPTTTIHSQEAKIHSQMIRIYTQRLKTNLGRQELWGKSQHADASGPT